LAPVEPTLSLQAASVKDHFCRSTRIVWQDGDYYLASQHRIREFSHLSGLPRFFLEYPLFWSHYHHPYSPRFLPSINDCLWLGRPPEAHPLCHCSPLLAFFPPVASLTQTHVSKVSGPNSSLASRKSSLPCPLLDTGQYGTR